MATIFFRLLTDDTREECWEPGQRPHGLQPDLWCNNAISTLTNMGIIDGSWTDLPALCQDHPRAQFAKIAVGFFETTPE